MKLDRSVKLIMRFGALLTIVILLLNTNLSVIGANFSFSTVFNENISGFLS